MAGPTGGLLHVFDAKSMRLKNSVEFDLSQKGGMALVEALGDVDESYLSLPLEALNFRVLEFPFSDPGTIRAVLPMELDPVVLGGADKMVFDLVVLGEAEGKCRVLAVYVSKQLLGETLKGLSMFEADPGLVTCIGLQSELASGPEAITELALGNGPELSETQRVQAASNEIRSPTINLRQGEFAFTRETDRARKSLRLSALLLSLLLLIASGGIFLRTAGLKAGISAQKQAIGQNYLSVFPTEAKKGHTGLLYRMKSHLKEMRGKANAYSGIEPLESLLGLSMGTLPQGLTVSSVTLEPGMAVLKGEGTSLSSVQEFSGSLGKLAFSSVKISDTKQVEKERIFFTITAAVTGANTAAVTNVTAVTNTPAVSNATTAAPMAANSPAAPLPSSQTKASTQIKEKKP